MFVGLVLCIERKKLQSGKPTREYSVTTFFSKDERRVYIRETYKGILGYNYLFKIERRVYIRETYKGILGYNYLFKMSVYEITQDTGSQLVE